MDAEWGVGVKDAEDQSSERRGISGLEGVFALVGLIERSFHEHTLEQLDALLDPDPVVHAPVPIEQGAAAFKRSLDSTRNAFPDIQITIQAGAAHDARVNLTGVDVERLENGKIVEHWSYWDRMSLAEQLGSPPRPDGEQHG